jgi:hypothetical protein
MRTEIFNDFLQELCAPYLIQEIMDQPYPLAETIPIVEDCYGSGEVALALHAPFYTQPSRHNQYSS